MNSEIIYRKVTIVPYVVNCIWRNYTKIYNKNVLLKHINTKADREELHLLLYDFYPLIHILCGFNRNSLFKETHIAV